MSNKVVNFFKNRDPNSVVRDSEINNARKKAFNLLKQQDPNSVVRESELTMSLIEKLLNNK